VITVDFRRIARLEGGSLRGFRVLDVGCGSGRHTCEAFRIEAAFSVGLDRNPEDLSEAGRRLRLHERLGEHGGGSWALAAGDAFRLPFRDAAFDLVICSEVLEHLEAPGEAVSELYRVLAEGRLLAVSVPRFYPERICWALSPAYRSQAGGHVRIFRKGELEGLLEGCGLEVVAGHFAHSLHSPYWWLKCLAGIDREDAFAVALYRRFLTWDILRKPRLTRALESLLDPVLGKSRVIYSRKDGKGFLSRRSTPRVPVMGSAS